MPPDSSARPAPPVEPTDLLLGLLVPPLLLGIAAARLLTDSLTQAGLVSEQIFAGERLPNLNLSRPAADNVGETAAD